MSLKVSDKFDAQSGWSQVGMYPDDPFTRTLIGHIKELERERDVTVAKIDGQIEAYHQTLKLYRQSKG